MARVCVRARALQREQRVFKNAKCTRVCEGARLREEDEGLLKQAADVSSRGGGGGGGGQRFSTFTPAAEVEQLTLPRAHAKTPIRSDARRAATRPQYWRNALLSLAGGGVRK